MGLELVEIAMEIEDRFGIHLHDEYAGRVRTVADLAMLVVASMTKVQAPCTTARTFYRLRTVLTLMKGDIARVRPQTSLVALVPTDLRAVWARIRAEFQSAPTLVASPIWHMALLGLLLCAGAVGIAGVVSVWWWKGGWVACLAVAVGVALWVLVAVIADRVERSVASRLPSGLRTVRDFVHAITPPAMPVEFSGERLMLQVRVLEDVRRIVAKQINLPIEQVKPESRLIEDLRCG